MRLKIKRLDAGVGLPQAATLRAAGFDLASAVDIEIPPRSIRLVRTGLVITVPEGYFLGIFARSSTPLRRGLMVSNGVGVIDPDYCGATDEIKVQVLNFTSTAVRVSKGDRLAQGLFIPVTRVHWQESTADLRDGSRGGFGATGR